MKDFKVGSWVRWFRETGEDVLCRVIEIRHPWLIVETGLPGSNVKKVRVHVNSVVVEDV